ncbi:hypothetical protein Bbelb_292710 [Branchiostoma belcheri]|nr:hypothetical protein Bbelb_292710 [Branchiostoma belcheri]
MPDGSGRAGSDGVPSLISGTAVRGKFVDAANCVGTVRTPFPAKDGQGRRPLEIERRASFKTESPSPACLNYRYGGVEPDGQPNSPGLDSPVAVIYTSGRRAFAARTASLDSRVPASPCMHAKFFNFGAPVDQLTAKPGVIARPWIGVNTIQDAIKKDIQTP